MTQPPPPIGQGGAGLAVLPPGLAAQLRHQGLLRPVAGQPRVRGQGSRLPGAIVKETSCQPTSSTTAGAQLLGHGHLDVPSYSAPAPSLGQAPHHLQVAEAAGSQGAFKLSPEDLSDVTPTHPAGLRQLHRLGGGAVPVGERQVGDRSAGKYLSGRKISENIV